MDESIIIVMSNPKKVYPTKNNKLNNVTGDLNLDGKGPDGGAKAFEKSREDILKEYIRSIVSEMINEARYDVKQPYPGDVANPSDQNIGAGRPDTRTVPVSKKPKKMPIYSPGEAPTVPLDILQQSEEQQRLAAWEEIEDLRKHILDVQRKAEEESAKKPQAVGFKKLRPVELPPLPTNLTKDFVDRVNKVVSWLEKSKMPPENRYAIDNKVYAIVADVKKTDKQKLKDIKDIIGAELDFINRTKMKLTNLEEQRELLELYHILEE